MRIRQIVLTLVTFSCVIVASLIAGVTIIGCTTVKNDDSSTSRVLGFESPEAQAKAQDTVNTIAMYLPPPFNTIAGAIGTAVVAGIGSYAAKKKGEDIGWDTAHRESPALNPAAAKPAT